MNLNANLPVTPSRLKAYSSTIKGYRVYFTTGRGEKFYAATL